MAVTIDPLWDLPKLTAGTPTHPMSMVVYEMGPRIKSVAYNQAADVGPGHKVKWDGTTKQNEILKTDAKYSGIPLHIENKKMFKGNTSRIEYEITLGAADLTPLVEALEYCTVNLESHSMVMWSVFNTNTAMIINYDPTDGPLGIMVTDANGEVVDIESKTTTANTQNAYRIMMYRSACNAATNFMLTRYEGLASEESAAA
jgi:hypothetical protein